MTGTLDGKRALITSADIYMGPAIAERLRDAGAAVVTDPGRYLDPDEPAQLVAATGRVDILVVNLQPEPPGGTTLQRFLHTPAVEQTDESWQYFFDRLVHPTARFVRAVLPQMIERRAGKIIVVTSAAPLRAMPGLAAYSTARGAQNTYVKVVGTEVARYNVQVNAVAQNFTIGGFDDDAMEDPRMVDYVKRNVPAGRLSSGHEQASLCLYLASSDSDFITGQVVPFAGGWVTT